MEPRKGFVVGPPPSSFRACGECGLCCKVVEVPEAQSPGGETCRHFAKGTGCTIHATRPQTCRSFQCFWTTTPQLGEEWRPDRCGFVLWTQSADQVIVEVDPDRPDAWTREPYLSGLRRLARPDLPGGVKVLIRVWPKMCFLFPEGAVELGDNQPDKSIEHGYQLRFDGKRVPFARFVDPVPAAAT